MPEQMLLLCRLVEICSLLGLLNLRLMSRDMSVQNRTIDYRRPVND